MPIFEQALRFGQPYYPNYTVTPYKFVEPNYLEMWASLGSPRTRSSKGSGKTTKETPDIQKAMKYQMEGYIGNKQIIEETTRQAKAAIYNGIATQGIKYLQSDEFKKGVVPVMQQINNLKYVQQTNKPLLEENYERFKSISEINKARGGSQKYAVEADTGMLWVKDAEGNPLKITAEKFDRTKYVPMTIDEYNKEEWNTRGFDSKGIASSALFQTAYEGSPFTKKLGEIISKSAAIVVEPKSETDLKASVNPAFLYSERGGFVSNEDALNATIAETVEKQMGVEEQQEAYDKYYQDLNKGYKIALKDKQGNYILDKQGNYSVIEKPTFQQWLTDEVKTTKNPLYEKYYVGDKTFVKNPDALGGGAGGNIPTNFWNEVNKGYYPLSPISDAWKPAVLNIGNLVEGIQKEGTSIEQGVLKYLYNKSLNKLGANASPEDIYTDMYNNMPKSYKDQVNNKLIKNLNEVYKSDEPTVYDNIIKNILIGPILTHFSNEKNKSSKENINENLKSIGLLGTSNYINNMSDIKIIAIPNTKDESGVTVKSKSGLLYSDASVYPIYSFNQNKVNIEKKDGITPIISDIKKYIITPKSNDFATNRYGEVEIMVPSNQLDQYKYEYIDPVSKVKITKTYDDKEAEKIISPELKFKFEGLSSEQQEYLKNKGWTEGTKYHIVPALVDGSFASSATITNTGMSTFDAYLRNALNLAEQQLSDETIEDLIIPNEQK